MNVKNAHLVNLEQSLSELVIEERQLQSFYATDLIKKLIYHVSDSKLLFATDREFYSRK